jgi:hypothetical protein
MLTTIKKNILTALFAKCKVETLVAFLNDRRNHKQIVIDGKEYPYLFHSYNNMGITERSVEIPIIYNYLSTNKFRNVLEVGNVTNYYESYFSGVFPNKTVVDKLEKNYNMITSDVAEYKSETKFDFIFSISTFEHMDSDLGRNSAYQAGSSKLCSVAADNIMYCYDNLLQEGGLMVITAPLGYTPEWDLTFKSGWMDQGPFKKVRRKLFKRINEEEWVQLEKFDLERDDMPYGKPYPYANYVSIIEILK